MVVAVKGFNPDGSFFVLRVSIDLALFNNLLSNLGLAGMGDAFMINREGTLQTPSIDAGILEGVTRNAIIELARAAGMTVRELALTRHDVYAADECFLTGTAAEVIPVVKCDGRPIGSGKPGPVTRQLRERFQQLVRQ